MATSNFPHNKKRTLYVGGFGEEVNEKVSLVTFAVQTHNVLPFGRMCTLFHFFLNGCYSPFSVVFATFFLKTFTFGHCFTSDVVWKTSFFNNCFPLSSPIAVKDATFEMI